MLTLSHFTVKEYLTSQRIQIGTMSTYGFDEKAAHTFMCRTLLAYLMQFDETDSLTRENDTGFPLAFYAARFWTHHAEAILPGTENVVTAIMGFLQPENAGYRNWIEIDDRDFHWLGPDRLAHPPLYHVSLGGEEKIAQVLIQHNANVNAEGGHYGNALQAASLWGREAIVRLLVDNHANVNAEGGYYGNALQAASQGGHEAIVRLLVENHANVNAEGGDIRQRPPGCLVGWT